MMTTWRILLALFITAFFSSALAQSAKLTIEVKGTTDSTVELYTFGRYDFYLKDKPFRETMHLSLNEHGVGSTSFELPGMLVFKLALPKLKYYSRSLYLEPGDALHVLVDRIDGKDSLIISGKGAANNQYLEKGRRLEHTEDYQQDTLPHRFLRDVDLVVKLQKTALEQYVARYKPSQAFINIEQLNIHYYPTAAFVDFYGNHKYTLRKLAHYESLKPIWDSKKDSLFQLTIDVNNPQGLISNTYLSLLQTYLLRRKEELWYRTDRDSMLAEYFKHWPVAQRMEFYNLDPENQLVEAIINTEFTGAINEYLYTVLFGNMIRSKKTNAASIYNRFLARYPNSVYLHHVKPIAAQWLENDSRALNEKMVLIADTGKFQSFDQLLSAFKGKTILIDLWGTWCAPCHEEIERSATALKAHFKGKDVLFLYVANYDERNVATWKKMIAYYNLEGTHVLANSSLSKSIMKESGGRGYPTYIVVKPDGSFALSKAGFPLKREVLIQQIEDAMIN